MGGLFFIFASLAVINAGSAYAQSNFEQDIIAASGGDIKITFIGHGTLMIEYRDLVIHVDPYSQVADYSAMPDADLILLTHHHGDHLDTKALSHINGPETKLIYTSICARSVAGGEVMANGSKTEFRGIGIEAVPAYNIVHKRDNGQPFHVRGEGNGYILTLGDKKIYIAGDTENIPEMEKIGGIYCAFLPMNLPYTMTPEMAAQAAQIIKPAVLYPYHFGDTDTSKLVKLLENDKQIEVRIRKMK